MKREISEELSREESVYRVPEKSLTISGKKHFISNEMFIMWKKTP